jgi:hypothetical protein
MSVHNFKLLRAFSVTLSSDTFQFRRSVLEAREDLGEVLHEAKKK